MYLAYCELTSMTMVEITKDIPISLGLDSSTLFLSCFRCLLCWCRQYPGAIFS